MKLPRWGGGVAAYWEGEIDQDNGSISIPFNVCMLTQIFYVMQIMFCMHTYYFFIKRRNI